MSIQIKQELHELVSKYDDETLLDETRELFQSCKDCRDDLSETDRNR